MASHFLILYGRHRRFFFVLKPSSDIGIGRDLLNLIRVSDPSASRRHCRVFANEGEFDLEDHGSSNGTFLNQRRIQGRVRLAPGDTIRIGSTYFRFISNASRTAARETLKRRLRVQNRMPGLVYCDRCDRRLLKESARYDVPHPEGVLTVCDACFGEDPLLGKTLGGYRIREVISRGGSGRIYNADQLSMSRPVALKVLNESMASDEESVGRFLREARSAGKLMHPNIVQLYDCGFADGHYYIAMEFVAGRTLDEAVAQEGPCVLPRALRYLREIADALAYAFRYQVIHRDIKPENIILTEEDVPKLLDFGLAKDLGESSHGVITDSGVGIGTPEYMPMEQIEDAGKADQRADVYALGGTFFFMLTGRPPIRGKTIIDIMEKIRTNQLQSLRKASPQTPPPVCALYERMTRYDPKERFQNPEDLLKTVQEVERSLGLSPSRQGGSPVPPTRS